LKISVPQGKWRAEQIKMSLSALSYVLQNCKIHFGKAERAQPDLSCDTGLMFMIGFRSDRFWFDMIAFTMLSFIHIIHHPQEPSGARNREHFINAIRL
jgi:hypothetical protein